ncbi:MAG: DUF927 domain-containing protein [Thiotrichales bacterium]|nr:DUF927 domain-containing protein [Thiotrichales bacterium]
MPNSTINAIFSVLAHSSTKTSTAYKLVSFTSTSNKQSTLLVPSRLGNNVSKFKDFLTDHHMLTAGHRKQDWDKIITIFNDTLPSKTFELTNRSGWHGKKYLMPNEEIMPSRQKNSLFFDPEQKLKSAQWSKCGDLLSWKVSISAICRHSSRVSLAVCAAFAGMIVRWTNIETGGFHFFGTSSIGKTTLLKVAATVYGNENYLQSWSTTAKGLEELAAAHSDAVLIMDELKLTDGNAKDAATKITSSVYALTNGKSKTRSSSYEANLSTWELLILSAGELSLSATASEGGKSRLTGERVRLIDIPADAGYEMGIFETLPDEFNNSRAYIDHIEKTMHQNFGSAARSFIRRLLRYNRLTKIGTYMDEFMNKAEIDTLNPPQQRIAKKFAICYAAGLLAIEMKVLSLDEHELFSSIDKCMNDALLVIDDNDLAIKEALDKLKATLLDPDDKQVLSTTFRGQDVIGITKERFDAVLGKYSKPALNDLKRRNLLVKPTGRSNTAKLSGASKNMYPISRAFLSQ